MKLQLWAIGKPHDAYVKDGIDDFTKRIANYYPVQWKLFAAAKQTANSTPEENKKQEAKVILNTIQKDDYLVLLDERGTQLTSPGLALFLEKERSAASGT